MDLPAPAAPFILPAEVVDEVVEPIALDGAPAASRRLLEDKIRGRVVVDVQRSGGNPASSGWIA